MKTKILFAIFVLVLNCLSCQTPATVADKQPDRPVVREKGEKEFQDYQDRKAAEWRGKQAPDSKLNLLDGTSTSISELKGKVVLLNFWFVACKPCQVEVASLNELYSQFADKGLFLVAAGTDSKEKTKEFAEQKKTKYQIMSDAKALADLYKVTTFPCSFLIDKKGVVREVFIGSSDFDATYAYRTIKPHLEALLKE